MSISEMSPYDGDRVSKVGERAVVAGGSIAGLCAARVLRDAFEEVLILERDQFPERPESRGGAPQTSQPHALLEAGRATLESFFPGFSKAVQAAGGLRLDMVDAFTWYDHGGFIATPEGDFPALYASRPLFEHIIRERLEAIENVQFRCDCHLLGYEHNGDDRVTGVRFRDESGTEQTLDATLVADATGRRSKTPAWLERHGYPTPDVDEVSVDVTYSTVRIRRPSAMEHGIVLAPEPDRPRGMAMLPIEDNQWEIVFQGLGGERSPADRETLLSWAAQLPVDEVEKRLREQEWLSEIHRYPFPSSLRRHYESLDRFPDGLVVTGDAIASFNPIYGQGMSVAALDALAIHHELADGLDQLGPRVFQRTTDMIDEVWKLAVGRDFTFEGTTGPKPFGTDLLNSYSSRLLKRAHNDPKLAEAFIRVFRLERSASSLFSPHVVWRVLRPQFGSGSTESTSRT